MRRAPRPSPRAILGAMVGQIDGHRRDAGMGGEPIDIGVFGISDPESVAAVARYADEGATWWLESLSPMRGPMDVLLDRIAAGPPSPA